MQKKMPKLYSHIHKSQTKVSAVETHCLPSICTEQPERKGIFKMSDQNLVGVDLHHTDSL